MKHSNLPERTHHLFPPVLDDGGVVGANWSSLSPQHWSVQVCDDSLSGGQTSPSTLKHTVQTLSLLSQYDWSEPGDSAKEGTVKQGRSK